MMTFDEFIRRHCRGPLVFGAITGSAFLTVHIHIGEHAPVVVEDLR